MKRRQITARERQPRRARTRRAPQGAWRSCRTIPLSGASRFRGAGHDIDIYALRSEAAPLVAEVKARASGGGFTTLERWLGEYDLLVLRRNKTDPMIVLPWRTWAALLKRARP